MATPQRISRKELDAAFAQKETAKSNLLLQAKRARDSGDDNRAARRFANAACLEEELAAVCDTQNLPEKAQMHYFSAAGCWAQAGDFHHALTLCETLLSRSGLPPRLRETITRHAAALQNRRARWYAELISTALSICAAVVFASHYYFLTIAFAALSTIHLLIAFRAIPISNS